MKRLFIPFIALLSVGSASGKTFQYLYLEANEGTASGGHVAVQFADEVFHYQYSEGLTRLTRDSRDSFEFDYRLLQNRSLHVADIAVSDAQFEQLRDSFSDEYWQQQRQFKQLQALKNDRWLLTQWLNPGQAGPTDTQTGLRLAAAGLFYSPADFADMPQPAGQCQTKPAAAQILKILQQRLQAKYGSDFLEKRRQTLIETIRQLRLADSETGYRQAHYAVSERYADTINQLLALRVISEGRGLQAGVCHSLSQPDWQLNPAQLHKLQQYQQGLLEQAISLPNAKRPDWGQALLVVLARLVVIQQTLDSGQWVFLDDFADDAEHIDSRDYPQQAAAMQRQRLKAEQQWRESWQQFNLTPTLSERFYTDLELTANRHREWQSSLTQPRFRFHGQQALPIKNLPLPLLVKPAISPAQLQANLEVLQVLIPKLSAELEQRYAYQLLTRNCVTELSATLRQAATGQPESVTAAFDFVPFVAFAQLQDRYTLTRVERLPSYRQQQLTEQYAQGFPPWVFLRESNILSASVYQYNPDDAAFVFFTDDAVLLRPVFGSMNTLAGLGQSLWGLLAWPVDDGKRWHSGVRGVLMSLPELAFVNIRKGSYKFALTDTLQPLTDPGP